MYLSTSAEMKLLDRIAMERFGLPGIVLMENASRAIARAALEHWPDWPAAPVAAVLAGPGQNGGDGWALARIFSALGWTVHCWLVQPEGKEVAGDAAINLGVAQKMGLPIQIITEAFGEWPNWSRVDLVIDALFGTGLDRPVTGPAERLLKSAGAAKSALGHRLRILAVDLPSGLSGDTGELWGPPLPADLTVALGAPKVGLYLKEGPLISGKVVVGDIGLTPQIIAQAPPLGRLAGPDEFHFLPRRPLEGHKGTFGHVLLAGGARGKTGALVLAAQGAARSGAALVTALHPASLGTIFETKLTEAMTLDLPEDEPGELAASAGELILNYSQGRQSLALGPGLGLGRGAAQTVYAVVDGAEDLPLVLDADALTHLAGRLTTLKKASAAVLTPHPGEAARLLAVTTAEIQNDRLGAARKMADLSGAVTVLKGYHTIIAEPGGQFFLNPTGGPHLAVGGSGDLLTGLTAGLLAQGLAPFPAAALAVWIHGRAGDLAAQTLGPRGLIPSDFYDCLPQVWRELSAPAGERWAP
ncbi:MAG: NAD(P)H-hydrate dehydratase [Candidatus Adiutrix sp.]|jgi:NAD(P)H-hydrate epimerase|nr:NAD(P)H-hydrate dehydratase [Candidatus Adiutrix sp.]